MFFARDPKNVNQQRLLLGQDTAQLRARHEGRKCSRNPHAMQGHTGVRTGSGMQESGLGMRSKPHQAVKGLRLGPIKPRVLAEAARVASGSLCNKALACRAHWQVAVYKQSTEAIGGSDQVACSHQVGSRQQRRGTAGASTARTRMSGLLKPMGPSSEHSLTRWKRLTTAAETEAQAKGKWGGTGAAGTEGAAANGESAGEDTGPRHKADVRAQLSLRVLHTASRSTAGVATGWRRARTVGRRRAAPPAPASALWDLAAC